MIATRLLQIIAGIAGLVALAFGMGTFTHVDFISIHVLFGLLVAISLLVIAMIAVFTRGSRGLGVTGIVYAFILPVFGVMQQGIWPDDWHWLIQTAHLEVGIGAPAFIGTIAKRYLSLKQTAPQVDFRNRKQSATDRSLFEEGILIPHHKSDDSIVQ